MKKITTLLLSLLVVACSTPKVSYVDPNAVNSLTTNFNQNDLRQTAQDLVQQLIISGKMNQCKTFTISPIKNSTDQYVDTSVMSNTMADKLTNSSEIKSKYVVSIEEQSNQIDELNRQNNSGLYDNSTTAKSGKMNGAQCRIDGKLTSDTSISPNGKEKLVAYSFFVQVFDVQSGTALWRNSKNISKSLTK